MVWVIEMLNFADTDNADGVGHAQDVAEMCHSNQGGS